MIRSSFFTHSVWFRMLVMRGESRFPPGVKRGMVFSDMCQWADELFMSNWQLVLDHDFGDLHSMQPRVYVPSLKTTQPDPV